MSNKLFVLLLTACLIQASFTYAKPATEEEEKVVEEEEQLAEEEAETMDVDADEEVAAEEEELAAEEEETDVEDEEAAEEEEEEVADEEEGAAVEDYLLSDVCPEYVLYEKDEIQLPNILQSWFVLSALPVDPSQSLALKCGSPACTVALGDPSQCDTIMVEVSDADIACGKINWIEYGLASSGEIIVNEIMLTFEDEKLFVTQVELINSVAFDAEGNEYALEYTDEEQAAVLAPAGLLGTNGFYDYMVLAQCSPLIGNLAVVLVGEESVKTKVMSNFQGGIEGALYVNGLTYADLVPFKSTERFEYTYTPGGGTTGDDEEEAGEEEQAADEEKDTDAEEDEEVDLEEEEAALEEEEAALEEEEAALEEEEVAVKEEEAAVEEEEVAVKEEEAAEEEETDM